MKQFFNYLDEHVNIEGVILIFGILLCALFNNPIAAILWLVGWMGGLFMGVWRGRFGINNQVFNLKSQLKDLRDERNVLEEELLAKEDTIRVLVKKMPS